MAQREIASGFIYPQTANAISGTTRYGKSIQKPFKILKGVDIDILFFIKTENGKSIALTNTEISCIVTKSIGNDVILSKKLQIQDEVSGIAKLRLTSTDTLLLESGFYHLNLLVKTIDGTSPVYLDTTFASNYYIEILDNFVNASPTIFETDTLYAISEKLYSKQLPGSAQYTSSYGVSTFAVKFNDFTGTIGLEASLETSPKDIDWFAIDLSPTTINEKISYTNFTGIEPFVFEGKFVWIRFVVENTNGTIDKIWYSV